MFTHKSLLPRTRLKLMKPQLLLRTSILIVVTDKSTKIIRLCLNFKLLAIILLCFWATAVNVRTLESG